MKTATEIINEKMNKGQLVFVSLNTTNAEGKTFSQIENEKFDKLDSDFIRLEMVTDNVGSGMSSTSDHPSTLHINTDNVKTIVIPADVEEFDDELCEVFQF
jgi:hypothetical protein